MTKQEFEHLKDRCPWISRESWFAMCSVGKRCRWSTCPFVFWNLSNHGLDITILEVNECRNERMTIEEV